MAEVALKEKPIEKVKEASGKEKALDIAVTHIEKQFGQGSIMRMGKDSSKVPIAMIPTGAITLDMALGIGGLPRGRIVEIFGPEASGKTTLALSVVANAQKSGGTAAYIDAEHAIDPAYSKRLGVDLDQLLISQPDCGEDALNITEVLIRSNAVDVIVIDSVAALVPKAEIEGDIGDSHMGLQARLMSQALRKLTAAVSRSKTCCVFINQIREKIGIMFGNPETTPGGLALKFYSSVRLDIRRTTVLKDAQNLAIGNRVKVKVVKNKVAAPFATAEFDIMYNEGISREGSILDLAIEHNIIEKKGAWLSFGERRLGQGRETVRDELKKDAKLTNEIAKAIKEKLNVK
jgi:recombination protein RecA